MTVSDFAEITTDKPEKTLLAPAPRKGGRNNAGRITTRHQGGGHKRRYRIIDFKRRMDGVPAKVASIEYDPNRSARIALLHYANGAKAYILAPQRLEVGQVLMSGPEADIKPGNCLPLLSMPTGTTVHAVELRPGQGAKLVRSAGVSAQLVAKEGDQALLRLPSGELRRVLGTCRATVAAFTRHVGPFATITANETCSVLEAAFPTNQVYARYGVVPVSMFQSTQPAE